MWTCFQMFQRSTSKIVGQPLTSPFLSGIMVLTAPLGALGALGARTKSAPLLRVSASAIFTYHDDGGWNPNPPMVMTWGRYLISNIYFYIYISNI